MVLYIMGASQQQIYDAYTKSNNDLPSGKSVKLDSLKAGLNQINKNFGGAKDNTSQPSRDTVLKYIKATSKAGAGGGLGVTQDTIDKLAAKLKPASSSTSGSGGNNNGSGGASGTTPTTKPTVTVPSHITAATPQIPLGILITNTLNIVYFIVGIVAVIIIIISGFQYLTSNGDPGKAQKALHTILDCAIGIAIALFAFAITSFVAGRMA
jgi:hypothetical protein